MTLPNRKPTRLKNYDYGTPGIYFVTICTHNRQILFEMEPGIVGNDLRVVPHSQNRIIHKWIKETENKFGVIINKYVIMPNHIQLPVTITERHTGRSLPDGIRW